MQGVQGITPDGQAASISPSDMTAMTPDSYNVLMETFTLRTTPLIASTLEQPEGPAAKLLSVRSQHTRACPQQSSCRPSTYA